MGKWDNQVRICPSVTVSDNYNRLSNKPSINGVTLEGQLSAGDLNLLTNDTSGYDEVTLGTAEKGSSLLVISPKGETGKITLEEVTKGRFETTNDTEDVGVGNYVFYKMEENKNGTDN